MVTFVFVFSCRRHNGAVNFGRSGSEQNSRALSGSSTCGKNIIQKHDPLSLQRFRIDATVSTQHIGTALRMTGNTGLGTVMPGLIQQRSRLNAQFLSHSLGQKLYLIIAPAKPSEPADRNPCQDIKAVGIFRQQLHRQNSAIALGITAGIVELIAEQTSSYVLFIVPDCGPTVKKLKFKVSFRALRRVNSAVMAQIRLILFQNFAAEDALGRKQLLQNPVNHVDSTFPCKRSFKPEYRRLRLAFSVITATVSSLPTMISSSLARVMAVYRILRLRR